MGKDRDQTPQEASKQPSPAGQDRQALSPGEGKSTHAPPPEALKASSLRRRLTTSYGEIMATIDKGRQAKRDEGLIDTFKAMYMSLEKYFSRFEEAWEELTDLHEANANLKGFPTDQDTQMNGTARRYYHEANLLYVELSTSSSAASQSISQHKLNSTEYRAARTLPEIKIPMFDGRLHNWPKFRDLFESLINKDPNISDMEKFHHLASSLSGPAASLIADFKLEERNYQLAWKAVYEAFNSKRLLASTYLNKILNFKQLNSKPSIEQYQQFLSRICDSVAAFKLLNIPNESEFILFHLCFKGLDQRSREQFEIEHKGIEFPTIKQLNEFVKQRCLAMQLASTTDTLYNSTSRNQTETNPVKFKPPPRPKDPPRTFFSKTNDLPPKKYYCLICKQGQHPLLECDRYKQASPEQRVKYLQGWKGCKNCLNPFHNARQCLSKYHCKFCPDRHHSTLHIQRPSPFESPTEPAISVVKEPGSQERGENTSESLSMSATTQNSTVILGTAVAEILDTRGQYQPVRLVIDSGSQCSFITQKCLNKLGLQLTKSKKKISGIGATLLDGVRGQSSVLIKPQKSTAITLSTEPSVVTSITSHLPTVELPESIRSICSQYDLADNNFWNPSPIDFLLGADLFPEIWTGQVLTLNNMQPKLFSSVFGYVLMGKINLSTNQTSTGEESLANFFSLDHEDDLNLQLKRFWEIEEPVVPEPCNPDDSACEEHFIETHTRLPDGRYMVRLPFKEKPHQVGDSSAVALKRFGNLEKRLIRDSVLYDKYCKFMSEYQDLGHMTIAQTSSKFIIPHHPVINESKEDIKLRVVFDASVSVPHGSLNQNLLIGEKLQNDIRDIILRFRQHPIVFTTDIVKMFRMILLHPEDRPYQHIYWRPSNKDPVKVFELNTVTYGLVCSPFLAQRVIKQLVIDHGKEFPAAAAVLTHERYVDDILTGSSDIVSAIKLKDDLIKLLRLGGFELSKWATNCPDLLSSQENCDPINFSLKEDTRVKLLGLQWLPNSDNFTFNIIPSPVIFTKRGVLSAVARLFDPLGFLAPTLLLMKSFIQILWKHKLDWDENIPPELQLLWERILNELPLLSQIRIPRFINTVSGATYQIIGFSDASERSYAAVLYFKVSSSMGNSIHLLMAKSKLAPMKPLTIPRLELCGALLLSQLYSTLSNFLSSLPQDVEPPVFFTDSTIVLGWLNTPIHELKVFIFNRVSQIIEIIPSVLWQHVNSLDNPADPASRGLLPSELIKNLLWWQGPSWLISEKNDWPISSPPLPDELPDLRPSNTFLSAITNYVENPLIHWMSRFSNFHKLLRSMARVLRWLNNCKGTEKLISNQLKQGELMTAHQKCIKVIQAHYFSHSKEVQLSDVTKQYSNLAPFVDPSGLIRVGGRLRNSSLKENHRHPILIPSKCHFASILVDYFHHQYLHPTPSSLQALIQTKYWIPGLRRLIRHRGFLCQKCYRSRTKIPPPYMADLPTFRVNGGRAFQHVGVDCAGPFKLKESSRRNASVGKAYLCLFICMATKALHLELMTSLSTEAFIASFQRFSSRRGLPTDIYSDNGTNFAGAANYLKELQEWFSSSDTKQSLENYAIKLNINWHFNPPLTPHMGGIWEAGIRSVKRHLKLIVGDTPLTFEEMYTVFSRIEAILNSRPLCSVSSSPEDWNYLCPANFLVGGPLVTLPEASLLDLKENLLSRWQLVSRMQEQFWKQWRIDYLSTLQKRSKWCTHRPNPQVDDIVLLKENSPPMKWPLARVTHVHPGADGVVRVVTVRLPKGTQYKRPVVNIFPLLPATHSFPHSS